MDANEPVCVSVEVYAGDQPGQPENLRVFVTHPRCAPSQVRQATVTLQQETDLIDRTGGSDADRVMILFPNGWPSAVLVWEPVTKTYAHTGGELTSLPMSGYLADGFTLVYRLDELTSLPPAVPGWHVQVGPGSLVLGDRHGQAALTTTLDDAPPGWVEAVRQRVLIALTGVELGLDAPSVERLHAAAKQGRLIASKILLGR
jgi:hypothetical protein